MSIVVILGFLIISLGLVFSAGVCCGDDAYHAIISKNLAFGLGYTSTVLDGRVSYSPTNFDSNVGVGPSIILPAAILIKLVGNTYWAPGLTIVIIWSVLLVIIGCLLKKYFNDRLNFTLAVIIFFFFSFTFFAYHFEQWYALFGEIPAALYVILAILVYFDQERNSNLLLTGLLFSLATQAKQIVFLAFISFLFITYTYKLISEKLSLKQFFSSLIQSSFLILLGFFIPIFIFELWKLISLGIEGYENYWLNYLLFFGDKGIGAISISLSDVIYRIRLLVTRFGIQLPLMFVLLLSILTVIRKDKKLVPIYLSFVFMILVLTIYWLFISVGWARYFVVCLVFIIFCLLFPFFSTKSSKRFINVYLLVLLCVSIINIASINITYPFSNGRLFNKSANSVNLVQISEILSTKLDSKPFVTQWWATAADIEYYMNSSSNFTTYLDQSINLQKQFIVVVNRKFILEDEFELLLKRCQTHELGQYVYGYCELDKGN